MNEYFVKEKLADNIGFLIQALQSDRPREANIAYDTLTAVIEDLPDGLKGIEREKKPKKIINNVIPIRTVVLKGFQ